MDAGEVRCREPRGAQAAGRGRRATPPIPSGSDGCVPEGFARALRRRLGGECRLQEDLGVDARVPERPVSVVAGRRIYLRHVPDPKPDPRLKSNARNMLHVITGAIIPLRTFSIFAVVIIGYRPSQLARMAG